MYRNDRTSRGEGVFVAVQSNITSVECTENTTDCELETIDISLKGKKDLLISSFFMAKRNPKELDQLTLAIDSTNSNN